MTNFKRWYLLDIRLGTTQPYSRATFQIPLVTIFICVNVIFSITKKALIQSSPNLASIWYWDGTRLYNFWCVKVKGQGHRVTFYRFFFCNFRKIAIISLNLVQETQKKYDRK